MGIEVSVTRRILRIAPTVGPDVAIIVGQAHAGRDAFLVIRHVEIPVVRRRAHQRGMVDPVTGRECGLRSRVAVVGAHSHSVETGGKE